MKIEDIFEYLVGGVTKPAQTRIKQVTRGDDSVVHIPQHKCWGVWCNFSEHGGISYFRNTDPYWCQWVSDGDHSIKGAKKEIDYYLSCFNEEQAKRERKRLRQQEKEVTYIKYP